MVLIRSISFLFVVALCLLACGNPPAKENTAVSLYERKCSLCHGADGKLASGGAKDLSTSTMTLEQVEQQITFGKGAMPPQKGIVTDEEIKSLAAYTLTLRQPKQDVK